MTKKINETVMCVRKEDFERLGRFSGFRAEEWQRYLTTLLTTRCVRWVLRSDCETNEDLKQIIPYMMLMHRTEEGPMVAVYQRSKMSGEERLHGKWTIGIGGHISFRDKQEDPNNTFQKAWSRELREEVTIPCKHSEEILGLLHDDSNAVGRVHLGVMLAVFLEFPAAYPKDPEVANLHFASLRSLVRHVATADVQKQETGFENWTNLFLRSPHAAGMLTTEATRGYAYNSREPQAASPEPPKDE